MKKVLLALLCGSLSMSILTACGNGQETAMEEVTESTVEVTVETTTEETTEVVEETTETVVEEQSTETTETVEETTENVVKEVTGEEADFPKVFTDDDPRTNAMTDVYAAYGKTFDLSKGKLYCWNIEGTPLVHITAETESYDTAKQLMSDDNSEISSFATVSTVDGEKEVLLLATEEVTAYAYTLGGYTIEIEEQAKAINSVEDLQHYVDLIRFE